mmetsp:Transcript_56266/g.163147  ORF Transcript_56266/g.163147 Transcript_56266/m.163147 type:complete len:305 (-) Transcript_56266:1131-2045(-)
MIENSPQLTECSGRAMGIGIDRPCARRELPRKRRTARMPFGSAPALVVVNRVRPLQQLAEGSELLQQDRSLQGLRWPLKPDASIEKLVCIDGARLVEVDQRKDAGRFGGVDVDASEELQHLWRVHLRLEGLPIHLIADRSKDLPRIIQKVLLLVGLRRGQHGVNEDAGHDIHNSQNRHCHIEHEYPPQHGGHLTHEGLHQSIPIDSACDGLEEGELASHEGPVVPLEIGNILGPRDVPAVRRGQRPPVFRHKLCDTQAYRVDDQKHQQDGPHQGLHGIRYGADEHAELADETHDPDDPHYPKES